MEKFDDLLFAIAYAIKCKAKLPRATKSRRLDVGDYEHVARVIVEHLRLCGYRIERLPRADQNSGVSAMPRDLIKRE